MRNPRKWHRFACLLAWLLTALPTVLMAKGGAFFSTGEKSGNPAAKGWSLDWTFEQLIGGESATSLARSQGLAGLSSRGYTNLHNRRSWYYLDDQPFHVVVISGSEPDGSAIYLMAGGSFESRELALKDAKELAWASWPFSAYQRYVIETYVLLDPATSSPTNALTNDLNGPSGDPGNGSGAPYLITDLEDLYLEEGASGAFGVHAGGTPPLTYRWHFNGGQTDSADSTFAVSYAGLWQDGHTAWVEVINAEGRVTSRVATLHVRQKKPNTIALSGNRFVPEGGSGLNTVEITISLEWPAPYGVYIDYTTQDGTATAYQDYLPVSGTLEIPPTQSSGKIAVQVVGNEVIDGDRTFSLVLERAVRALIVQPAVSITIEDDDSEVETYGMIDPAFAIEVDGAVPEIALAPDYGLYVGGHFTTLNGVARSSLGKVLIDGTTDPDFAPMLADINGNPPHLKISSGPQGEVWMLSDDLVGVNGALSTGWMDLRGVFKVTPPATATAGWRPGDVSFYHPLQQYPDAGTIWAEGLQANDQTGAREPWVTLRAQAPQYEIVSTNNAVQWMLPEGRRLVGFSNFSVGYPFTSLLRFGPPILLPGANYSYLDESFVTEGPVADVNRNFRVWNIVDVDSLGRILLLVSYHDGGNHVFFGLHRVLADGKRDPSFAFAQVENHTQVYAVQPDGKILLGGTAQLKVNGTAYEHLARLQTDGTIDPSFRLKGGLGVSESVTAIVAAGNSMAYVGTAQGIRRIFTGPATLPTLTTPLLDQKFPLETPIGYLAAASGLAPIHFEWLLDGTPMPTTTETFQLTPTDPSFVGEHTLQVVAINPVGRTESRVATLTILAAEELPVITRQPVPQIIDQGAPPRFSVEATSPTPLRYQWYYNFQPLAGENGPALVGVIDTRDWTGTRSIYVDVSNAVWTQRSHYVYLQVEPFEDYTTWSKEVFDPSLLTSFKSNPLWDLNHDGITNYQAFLMGLDPAETEGLARRATRIVVRDADADFVRFTYSLTASRLQPYFEQSGDLVSWELAWGTVLQFNDTGRSRSVLVKFPRPSGDDGPKYYRAVYHFTD